MEYLTIEELMEKAGGSAYKLMRLAAQRAIELSQGKKPFVDMQPTDALTTVALKEIAQGKVVAKDSEELLAVEEVPEEIEEEI